MRNVVIYQAADGMIVGTRGSENEIPDPADGLALLDYDPIEYPDPRGMRIVNSAIVQPDPTLDEMRAQRWIEAQSYRDLVSQSGCMTPAGRVQTDPDSQRIINGAFSTADYSKRNGLPFALGFTLEDNSTADVDADGMIAIGLTVSAYIATCHAAGTAIRDQIIAATTLDELAAIDTHAGYPA